MTQTNSAHADSSGCNEAMSRLIDGELDPGSCRELLQRLGTDEQARNTWVFLNIVCDAIRSSETAAMHSPGFVSRVSAALEAEPVILAPGALRRRHSVLRRVIIPTAAVAAAAAVLAVVAVPQLRGPDAGKETLVLEETRVPASAPEQDLIRSAEFEAYLSAHRNGAHGPLSSGAHEFMTPASMSTTEPR